MIKQESLSGHWNTIAGAVREKYHQITGDELGRAQGNLEQLIGLIQRKSGETRDQIEKFLNESVDSAGATYKQVAQKASQMASQAGEAMQEGYQQLSDRAEQGYEYARDTVSRRPMESIAVVAGVSLLAGLAIGISMCSRR